MFTFGKPAEVKTESRSNFPGRDYGADDGAGQLRTLLKQQLTQAELENKGLCLAGKGEISHQFYPTVNRFNATTDVARVRFHTPGLFSQCGQHFLCILLIGKHLAVGGSAIGIVHHGANINTTTGGSFLGATFIK
jgi:hypothetical protein